MQALTKHLRRTVVITSVAAVAVAGLVGIGAAAYADGSPSTAAPSASGAPGPASSASAAEKPATPPKPMPHIGGTVESITGSTITVKDMDGFTRTVLLGDNVTVTKTGSSMKTSITHGEHIDATGSVDRNGTSLDASAVTVGTPTPPAGGPAAEGPAAGAPTPPVPRAGASTTAQSGAPAAPSIAPSSGTTSTSGS